MKPEIAKHELLFQLEQETGFPIRFVWAILPTACDREGRFKWRPGALKTDLLPYDAVDFEAVLSALVDAGFLHWYEVDGEAYGYIPTFHKHQVINQRESQSQLPAPPDVAVAIATGMNVPPATREEVLKRDGHRCVRCKATNNLSIDHIFPRSIGGNHAIANLRTLCRSCNSARPVGGQALDDDLARDGLTRADMPRLCTHVHAHAASRGEGKGRELEGKEDSSTTPRVAEPALLSFPTIGTGPKTWSLRRADVTAWQEAYPGLDILGECRRALAWVNANQAKTAKGMPAFLVNWFNRAVQRGGNSRPTAGAAVRTSYDAATLKRLQNAGVKS